MYPSKKSIKEAIKHFGEVNVKSGEQVGFLLFGRFLGYNTVSYQRLYKKSEMSTEYLKRLEEGIFHLSSIFDYSEVGIERWSLFPFSINNSIEHKHYYNPKTAFKGIAGRITDTFDNTLLDKYYKRTISNNSESLIKIKYDYHQYFKENYLVDGKFSLTHFVIYFCRFINFETDDDSNLLNACMRYTIKFLKLTQQDIETLFIDDIGQLEVSFDDTMITGKELRAYLSFAPETKHKPNIIDITDEPVIDNKLISFEEVGRLKSMLDNNPSKEEIQEILNFRSQIILYGVPGVGKSRFVNDLIAMGSYTHHKVVQFHPSTSYENFIGGTTIKNNTLETFIGAFVEWCELARKNAGDKYLFVIDEINRANISKVFGETIMTLDREYEVELLKPLKIDENSELKNFRIPENLHIIGTMNSSDRSISVLDNALRRRFAFVKISPNYDVVKELSDCQELDFEISELFSIINKRIYSTLGSEDFLLGQSYFLPKYVKDQNGVYTWSPHNLRLTFNFSIIPILEEYTHGNPQELEKILGQEISSRLNDDDIFLKTVKSEFFQGEEE